ncbi:MAG: LysM domain-containing protein [Clostridia bacterium]|nr:LysM domain-containing protein [Clostridia bacterium]
MALTYYNFENYFQYYDKYNGCKPKIYKNISYIISTLLKKELKKNKIPFMGFYNKPYKMILQKCDTALYKNIPELVVEFTKAEKICDVQDTTSAASKYLSAKRKLLQKYVTGGLVLLIVAVIVYMFYPLFADKNAPSSIASKIGTLVYNENIYTPEIFHVGDPVSDPPPPFDYTSISIPANDDDILYEEYIVQYGDTFKSICQQYYNNENLVNAVVSFNSLNASDTLNAGFILKLPSPSVIEKFVVETESKNSRATSSSSSELDLIF